jgi:hypothetical protein
MYKIIKVLFALFLLFILVPEIYLYPFYLALIKPTSENKIQEAINQVRAIENHSKKLEELVVWEVRDFYNSYSKKPDFCLDLFCRYAVYNKDELRIRVLSSIIPELQNNPYWVAYFKVGGCGELATLFRELTYRVGFDSRVVGTKGEDHSWVEVKISGRWVHADPTIYYLYYHSAMNLDWFDNPMFYDRSWFRISRVIVDKTEEDITKRYTDVGLLKVNFTSPVNRLIITTMKGDRERVVLVTEVNTGRTEVYLGGKVYKVTAEKDILPYILVLKTSSEIKVAENQEVYLELEPSSWELKSELLYFVASIVVGVLLGRISRGVFLKKRVDKKTEEENEKKKGLKNKIKNKK